MNVTSSLNLTLSTKATGGYDSTNQLGSAYVDYIMQAAFALAAGGGPGNVNRCHLIKERSLAVSTTEGWAINNNASSWTAPEGPFRRTADFYGNDPLGWGGGPGGIKAFFFRNNSTEATLKVKPGTDSTRFPWTAEGDAPELIFPPKSSILLICENEDGWECPWGGGALPDGAIDIEVENTSASAIGSYDLMIVGVG